MAKVTLVIVCLIDYGAANLNHEDSEDARVTSALYTKRLHFGVPSVLAPHPTDSSIPGSNLSQVL